MHRQEAVTTSTPRWQDGEDVCALSDGDRHLGHIERVEAGWKAYDATHPDGERNGFKDLGVFDDVISAKAAVELSCAMVRVKAAGNLWIS